MKQHRKHETLRIIRHEVANEFYEEKSYIFHGLASYLKGDGFVHLQHR